MELATLRKDMKTTAREMLALHFNSQYPINDGRIVPVTDGRSNAIHRLNSSFQKDLRSATGERTAPLRSALVEIVDGVAREIGYELKPIFWKSEGGFRETPYYEGQNPVGHYWVRSC